jgi:hypothetical protein
VTSQRHDPFTHHTLTETRYRADFLALVLGSAHPTSEVFSSSFFEDLTTSGAAMSCHAARCRVCGTEAPEQQVVTTDYNHESHEIVRFFFVQVGYSHLFTFKTHLQKYILCSLQLHLKKFLFYSTIYCNHPSLYSTSKSTNIYFIYFT